MNKSRFENHLLKLFFYYAMAIMIIGIVSRTFPVINFLYYLVPALLFIFLMLSLYLKLFKEIDKRILFLILGFPIYALIASLWSLHPLITFQRSLFLILVYAGILSIVFLYGKFSSKFNIAFLIPANILIIIISIFSIITNTPANSWSGGNGLGFMGFAGHQNTLAAALLFTLPGVIAFGIEQRVKRNEYSSSTSTTSAIGLHLTSRVFRLAAFILLLTANLLILLFTYSRASILALVIGTITYLLITKSKKILTFLFSITALLMVLYFTVPFVQNKVNEVLNKDGGKIFDRRMILWKPSYEAAKQGGLIGLGYGVSATDINTPLLTGSHYEDARYVREKGNSTLAIIEETGLIGLILFLLPVFYIALKLIINKFGSLTTHYSLLTAALAAMLVHSQFEAWWVGVGSVSLPLFLIILFTLIISKK